jgi:hypothetical protein
MHRRTLKPGPSTASLSNAPSLLNSKPVSMAGGIGSMSGGDQSMIRLCDLHWRKRRRPSDVLVGKVGSFWLMLVPRSGRDIGKDDPGHDLPYATLFIESDKPFEGPDLPERKTP